MNRLTEIELDQIEKSIATKPPGPFQIHPAWALKLVEAARREGEQAELATARAEMDAMAKRLERAEKVVEAARKSLDDGDFLPGPVVAALDTSPLPVPTSEPVAKALSDAINSTIARSSPEVQRRCGVIDPACSKYWTDYNPPKPPEADHAKQLAELEAALAVAVNAMADLSGLIRCEAWCDRSKTTKATHVHIEDRCTCGNEREHQGVIDAANKNALVAAAVAKAKGTQ